MSRLMRDPGRAWQRALAATVVAGGLALVLAAPAWAHAELESSVPAMGAVVEASPERIELLFNEEVTTSPDQVQLLDPSGAAVAAEVVTSEGTNDSGAPASMVEVIPAEELTTGPWVVSWKIVSADGHLVSGAVDFSVGSGPSLEPPADTESDATVLEGRERAAEIPSRVLEGMGWLAGIAAGLLLVLSRSRRVILALAGVGTAAAALYAYSLAAPVGNWAVALQVGEVRAALAVALAGATAFVGTLLSGALSRSRAGAARAVAMTSGAAGLALFSAQSLWSGHHLLSGSVVATGAHAAHLAAGAAWVAAVVALLADRTAGQARRTRVQATWAVAVLIPAAVATALWTSGALSGSVMWGGWTMVLGVKVTLVLLALLLGALNHRALAPARLDTTMGSPARLRRFLILEVAVLGLVVASSAALTLYTPPPAAPPAVAVEEAPATLDPLDPLDSPAGLVWPQAVPLTLDDGVEVSLVPSVQSNGDVHLELTPGWPIPEATGPAKLLAEHEAGLEVTAYLEPDGSVFAGSTRLPLAGHWSLTAEIPVDAFTLRTAEGHVDVAAAQPGAPGSTSGTSGAGTAHGGATP